MASINNFDFIPTNGINIVGEIINGDTAKLTFKVEGVSNGTLIWFNTEGDVDNYFLSHPEELVEGVIVGVGNPVNAFVYNGESWTHSALAFKGEKGDDGGLTDEDRETLDTLSDTYLRLVSETAQVINSNVTLGRGSDGKAYQILGVAADSTQHTIVELAEYDDGQQIEIGSESIPLCLNHKETSGWSQKNITVNGKLANGTGFAEYLAYLSDIPTGFADVAFSGSYSDLLDPPTIPALPEHIVIDPYYNTYTSTDKEIVHNLVTVSHTGSYTDLVNTPTIPSKISDLENDSDFLEEVAWEDVKNKPDFADVATSGQYSDLEGTPSIPSKTSDLTNDAGFITGLNWTGVTSKPTFATVATSGSYNDLTDTPTLPTLDSVVKYTDIVNNLTSGGTGVPLSAEQGKILDGKVTSLAKSNQDRGTVHNALTAQGQTYGVTAATVAGTDTSANYQVGDALFVPSTTSSDINAIIIVSAVNGAGKITGVTISKNGDYTADVSGNVACLGGHGTGALLALTSILETASTIDDIVDPQPNDRVIVLQDETHNGLKYNWGFMDYNGDGIYNFVPIAPYSSEDAEQRDFNTSPIVAGELASNAVTTAKIVDGAVTSAKLESTLAATIANIPTTYLTLAGFTWAALNGKPTFATVATSGSYNDLTNKPTIPTNTNQLTNGSGFLTDVSWSTVSGKPTFATVATSGSYNDLTNKPSGSPNDYRNYAVCKLGYGQSATSLVIQGNDYNDNNVVSQTALPVASTTLAGVMSAAQVVALNNVVAKTQLMTSTATVATIAASNNPNSYVQTAQTYTQMVCGTGIAYIGTDLSEIRYGSNGHAFYPAYSLLYTKNATNDLVSSLRMSEANTTLTTPIFVTTAAQDIQLKTKTTTTAPSSMVDIQTGMVVIQSRPADASPAYAINVEQTGINLTGTAAYIQKNGVEIATKNDIKTITQLLDTLGVLA
jgi:hypothetical protein